MGAIWIYPKSCGLVRAMSKYAYDQGLFIRSMTQLSCLQAEALKPSILTSTATVQPHDAGYAYDEVRR